MATVGIIYHFSEGEELDVRVEIDASYPDAIDEARKQALATYREALGVSIETTAGDEDE